MCMYYFSLTIVYMDARAGYSCSFLLFYFIQDVVGNPC